MLFSDGGPSFPLNVANQGLSFHTNSWPENFTCEGKKLAVIGLYDHIIIIVIATSLSKQICTTCTAHTSPPLPFSSQPGTGATSVQAVPGLAEEKPQQLNVFQRTAGSLHTEKSKRIGEVKMKTECTGCPK